MEDWHSEDEGFAGMLTWMGAFYAMTFQLLAHEAALCYTVML